MILLPKMATPNKRPRRIQFINSISFRYGLLGKKTPTFPAPGRHFVIMFFRPLKLLSDQWADPVAVPLLQLLGWTTILPARSTTSTHPSSGTPGPLER